MLICCGPVCGLGITTTAHIVSFQLLGRAASMSFLDFSVPWYHCCQGCMTASSVAPGPPLSSGCLLGDKGRASSSFFFKEGLLILSVPHLFPSLSRCQDQEEVLRPETSRKDKLYGVAWISSSLPPAKFLIIFLAPVSGAKFNNQVDVRPWSPTSDQGLSPNSIIGLVRPW